MSMPSRNKIIIELAIPNYHGRQVDLALVAMQSDYVKRIIDLAKVNRGLFFDLYLYWFGFSNT